jgi:hypothetical protein
VDLDLFGQTRLKFITEQRDNLTTNHQLNHSLLGASQNNAIVFEKELENKRTAKNGFISCINISTKALV